MAGKGGKRAGAGRPPSTLKGIAKRLPGDSAALILAEINANQKWIALANSKDERIQLDTLKYLTDRAHGKPAQAVIFSEENTALDFGGLPTSFDAGKTGKPN